MIQYTYHKLAAIIDEGLVKEIIVKLLVFDFYKEMHADMIDTTVTISESVLLYKSDRMGCNLAEAESVSAVGEGKVPFVLKVFEVFENAAYINGFHRILVDGNLV